MHWYIEALRKYAEFSGRSRRKEYWFFILFNMIFGITAMILDNVLVITIGNLDYGPIYLLYTFAVLIPGWAVMIRRLHDVGKSGWMFLINLIPIVGWIWFLVLMVRDSEPGQNQYGPNPKGVVTHANITSQVTQPGGNFSSNNTSQGIKYCPGCGAQVQSEANFCVSCGRSITGG